MIAYHPQTALKRFGPPTSVRETGVVDVYSMSLWRGGKQIGPRKKLTREELELAEVELSCFASLEEYDAKRARVSVRIPWNTERFVLREVWRRMHDLHEFIEWGEP